LKDVSILLSRTEGPVNLGFIARAMANTGFTSLSYTGDVPLDHEDAQKFAVHAGDMLSGFKHADSFENLISDSDVLIGFTPRDPFSNSLPYAELKNYVYDSLSKGQTVGLLFGNEAHGLDNDEISSCTKTVALPTSEDYVSMNLAQAVLVTLWELKDTQTPEMTPADLADRDLKNLLLNVVKEHLELIDYFKEKTNDPIWQEIKQTFETKELTVREAELIISMFGKSSVRYKHLLNNSK